MGREPSHAWLCKPAAFCKPVALRTLCTTAAPCFYAGRGQRGRPRARFSQEPQAWRVEVGGWVGAGHRHGGRERNLTCASDLPPTLALHPGVLTQHRRKGVGDASGEHRQLPLLLRQLLLLHIAG